MAFQVEEMAIEVVQMVERVMPRIRARDRALADQISRAASSVALNIGEGNYSDPGNRRARFFTARGSANETRLGLRIAAARRHCAVEEVEPALALLNRVLAILRALTQ